jgi:putative selenium metabolism hydrolase
VLDSIRCDELVKLCQDMIGCPSPSGHEDDIVNLTRDAMISLGYDDVRIDRYGNVVGRIVLPTPGNRILFDGHLDHVDVSCPDQWTVPPFSGTIKDNRVYGRGASDMKGSLAAMILAAAYLREDCGHMLRGEILVAGIVHEECFEGVASREVGESYKPDYVVIGEASQLNLNVGQRGRAEIVVETQGKSAHSSNPEAGLNAVKKMVRVISAIEDQFSPPTHPLLGKGILELTDIISSPYPGASVVPEKCKVTFDRRLLVGETEESVLSEIKSIIARIAEDDPGLKATVKLAAGEARCYTGESIQAVRFAPAWLIDENHEFVRRSLDGLHEAGLKPKISKYNFCTNGSYYAGIAGIPTVGFGASREDLAHVTDEYVEIDQLVGACLGYYGIAKSVLSV